MAHPVHGNNITMSFCGSVLFSFDPGDDVRVSAMFPGTVLLKEGDDVSQSAPSHPASIHP